MGNLKENMHSHFRVQRVKYHKDIYTFNLFRIQDLDITLSNNTLIPPLLSTKPPKKVRGV